MTLQSSHSMPSILSIAGLDPSGGAGLLADMKTNHALQTYGLSVATTLTVQNARGVAASYPVDPNIVQQQLAHLSQDYQFDAIKIGALGSQQLVLTVAEWLKHWLQAFPKTPVVLDPVIVSSSGHALLASNAIQAMTTQLFPLVSLITPNGPELEELMHAGDTGLATPDFKNPNLPSATLTEQFSQIAHNLRQQHQWPAILLTGGHSFGEQAIDRLFITTRQVETFKTAKLNQKHNHGTGCTLSSAIASYLAKGESLPIAVKQAKHYLTQALAQAHLAQPHYLDNSANTARKGGLAHFYNQQ